MANTNIGRVYQITTGDHTNTLILGDASPSGESVSAWTLHIVDGSAAVPTTLTGGWKSPAAATMSLSIVARSNHRDAAYGVIPFVATVYRKLFLNGAVGDGTLVSTAITTTSVIVVPANGLSIAILVTSATVGNALVYATPVIGPSAI